MISAVEMRCAAAASSCLYEIEGACFFEISADATLRLQVLKSMSTLSSRLCALFRCMRHAQQVSTVRIDAAGLVYTTRYSLRL